MSRTHSRIRAVVVAAFALLVPRAHAAPAVDTAAALAASAAAGGAGARDELRAADIARPVAALGGSLAAAALAQDPDAFPGRTYGHMRPAACLAELDARRAPYARVGRTRGVDVPMRVTGPLRGVSFHADGVDFATSAHREVMDCRLVLALDDLAGHLAKRGIAEVVHYGIYRDGVVPARGLPRHHVAGLAIDVAAFVKTDGTRLEVTRDFHGRPGARTCTPADVPARSTDATRELRALLCDVVDTRTFHQVLTPNHDLRHRDHFHLEVMRNTGWTLVE